MNRNKKRYNDNMHLKIMEAVNTRVLKNHDIYYSASVERIGSVNNLILATLISLQLIRYIIYMDIYIKFHAKYS